MSHCRAICRTLTFFVEHFEPLLFNKGTNFTTTLYTVTFWFTRRHRLRDHSIRNIGLATCSQVELSRTFSGILIVTNIGVVSLTFRVTLRRESRLT